MKLSFKNFRILADGFNFSRTPGIQPNLVQVSAVVPEQPAAQNGHLIIDDDQHSVIVKNLWLQRYTRGTGRPHQFTLVDSRHRWAFAPRLHGEHNRPTDDGQPNAETRIGALGQLCLDALREVGLTKSNLGDLDGIELWPHVKWEWKPPAEALQELCDLVGCQICLQLDDSVTIRRIGSGDLPKGTFRYAVKQEGIAASLRPRKLLVRGGRIVLEETIDSLVPVGLDTDGEILPIASLSYTPGAGWQHDQFDLGTADKDARAAASVWKWYRLPTAHLYKLPMLQERVTTVTQSGVKLRLPPRVEVKACNIADRDRAPSLPWTNDSAWQEVQPSEYTLDRERGLVMFHHPQFKANATTGDVPWTAADVRITYAYESLQDDSTVEETDYYTYSSGSGKEYDLIEAPDLVLYKIDGEAQNATELNAHAAMLVRCRREADAETKDAQYTLIGAHSLPLGGLVQSIGYQASQDGVQTTVSVSTDRPAGLGAPGYRERLFVARSAIVSRAVGEILARDRRNAPAGLGAYRLKLGPTIQTASHLSDAAPGRAWQIGINSSGSDIPARSIVELDGTGGTTALVQLKIPSDDAVGQIAIVEDPIPNGAKGRYYTIGDHVARVESGVVKGDRVSTKASSHVAQKDDNGNLLVRDVLGAAGGDQYALVFFSHKDSPPIWVPTNGYTISTGTPRGPTSSEAIIELETDDTVNYEKRLLFPFQDRPRRNVRAFSFQSGGTLKAYLVIGAGQTLPAGGYRNVGDGRLLAYLITEDFAPGSLTWENQPAVEMLPQPLVFSSSLFLRNTNAIEEGILDVHSQPWRQDVAYLLDDDEAPQLGDPDTDYYGIEFRPFCTLVTGYNRAVNFVLTGLFAVGY